MKKLTIAALVTVVIAGATYTAMSQHHRGGPGQMLEQVDANADGAVTKAEIDAHRADKFASADTNGDNLVSASEFEAFAFHGWQFKAGKTESQRWKALPATCGL